MYRATSFAVFKHMLQQHEITTHTKYISYVKNGQMNDEEFQIQLKHRIMWDEDVPYVVAGTRAYACHLGKDMSVSNKKKYAEKREKKAVTEHVFTKRHNWKQPTKKLDCPVRVKVKRVLRFCDYKATKKRQKELQVKAIRLKMEANEKLQTEEVFLFNLPDPSEHNHSIGVDAPVTEPLDPRVLNKLKELARKGLSDPNVISDILEKFVKQEIGDVSKVRRRFNPNREVIKCIVRRTKHQLLTSKIDQEDAENWVIDQVPEEIAVEQIEGQGVIEIIGNGVFKVPSNSATDTFYTVHLKQNEQISCTCEDFCKKSLMCKHMARVGMRFPDFKIDNLAKWTLPDPVYCAELLCSEDNTEKIETEMASEEQTVHFHITNEAEEVDVAQQDCEEPPSTDSKKKNLIMKCNETIRSLQSVMLMLPEECLTELDGTLSTLCKSLSSQAEIKKAAGFPVRVTSASDLSPGTSKRKCEKPSLKTQKRTKRVRIAAASTGNNANLQNVLGETTLESQCTATTIHVADDALPGVGQEVVEELIEQVVMGDKSGLTLLPDGTEAETIKLKLSVSNQTYELSTKELERQCQPGVKLTHEVVNYAQQLIKKQKNALGLQNTLLGQTLAFKVETNCVQILHDGSDHWITVKVVNAEKVEVYNSLHIPLSDSLLHQIIILVNDSDSKFIELYHKSVQEQQKDSNDSGVLAIAFAFSLVRGSDPTTISYDSAKLRGHLQSCIKKNIFSNFPQTSAKRLPRIKPRKSSLQVYTVCQ